MRTGEGVFLSVGEPERGAVLRGGSGDIKERDLNFLELGKSNLHYESATRFFGSYKLPNT